MHANHASGFPAITTGLALLLIVLAAMYVWAAIVSDRLAYTRRWPVRRYACWLGGIACVAVALIGPLAERAHADFAAHMAGHLFLGMLAPILLVLAAPVTLLLRTLPISGARRVARLMKSRPGRLAVHPVFASLLNIGGLWVLYTTPLYGLMQYHVWVHLLVHFHVLAAGYLFTASMISIDPAAHRLRFLYRAVVLMAALTGHTVLSKLLYAYPPAGVTPLEGETGALLMYYGGDLVDMMLIFVFCLQGYRAVRPQSEPSLSL